MLLKMTLHMSSCCCFPYRHICRKFSRSANLFFSISSEENSLVKVTHCQNVLFILFIQCFAEREAQGLYQRLNWWRNKKGSSGAKVQTPNQRAFKAFSAFSSSVACKPNFPTPSDPPAVVPASLRTNACPVPSKTRCRVRSSSQVTTDTQLSVRRGKNTSASIPVANKPVWKHSTDQRLNLCIQAAH